MGLIICWFQVRILVGPPLGPSTSGTISLSMSVASDVGCVTVLFGSNVRMAPMYIVMYTKDMLQRYSIAEARAHLPRIVDQAEAGIEVELTRRGRAVAVLVSRQKFDRLRGKGSHFRETYRKFLEKYSAKGIGVEDEFIVSMRDKSTGRKVSL